MKLSILGVRIILGFYFFVGHVLHSMVREHRSQFLDRVAQFCSGNWRERVFQVSFVCRICFSGTVFIVNIEGEMSCTKTKYMLNREVGNKVKEIELMGKKYEKVESFKYLGAMITSLNEIKTEIKSKIAVGNKCYCALETI